MVQMGGTVAQEEWDESRFKLVRVFAVTPGGPISGNQVEDVLLSVPFAGYS